MPSKTETVRRRAVVLITAVGALGLTAAGYLLAAAPAPAAARLSGTGSVSAHAVMGPHVVPAPTVRLPKRPPVASPVASPVPSPVATPSVDRRAAAPASSPTVAVPRPVRTAPAARAPRAPAGPTAWPELNAAIAKIPGYRNRPAVTWHVHEREGHWGTADPRIDTVWISPDVPRHRLFDVVVHEYAHILQGRIYDRDLATIQRALNARFGGSDWVGAERAADCMARRLGAGWTHYTSCQDRRWQQWAGDLLAGTRL